MKSLCRLLLVAVFAATLPHLFADRIVRITNGEWPPYLGEQLPYYGIASRIVTEAFRLQGVSIQYGFFPWKRALLLATTPDWDGAAVWLRNSEREQDFYFSDSVVDSSYVFFHLKGTPFSWNSIDDLRKYYIGTTNEYFYGQEFMTAVDQGRLFVQGAPSDEQNFRKLLAGHIDVFPMDRIAGLALLNQSFTPEEVKNLTFDPKELYSQPLYLLLSKSRPENRLLIMEFNRGLQKLKVSGQVDLFLKDADNPPVPPHK